MVNTATSVPSDPDDCFVAAVDVGTTYARCQIYNKSGKVCGSSDKQIELLHPQLGREEINPDHVWKSFVSVVKEALVDASLTAQQISCMGISTQRNTFTTWNRHTGATYHNFITWKDLRATKLTEEWNNSWSMKFLRSGGKLLHSISRQKRFLAASILVFATEHVITRLKWVLENVDGLQESAESGDAIFGMIETWLLWKVTKGKKHCSDYSCVSSTAMFDPFLMDWGDMFLKLFSIPKTLLPELKDTSGLFGYCDPDIFGAPIPITCLVADQQAAMFGERCFGRGDVKCTMGTGSFLDINTGDKPHTSLNGLYPLIGWKYGSEIAYIAEGKSNDTGTAISWLQTIGLVSNPEECDEIAKSISTSNGVHFVPAFSGLQAPLNDNSACAGFLGICPTTQREHLVRAVLESLAFRVKQIYDIMELETDYSPKKICVDGGVANSDFILQMLADLTHHPVERPVHTEMSALGAAYFAGLAVGVWKNKEELANLAKPTQTFIPNGRATSEFREWERAVSRCMQWYRNPF